MSCARRDSSVRRCSTVSRSAANTRVFSPRAFQRDASWPATRCAGRPRATRPRAAQLGVVPADLREERRSRRQRGPQQPRLLATGDDVRCGARAQRALEHGEVVPAGGVGKVDRRCDARRQSADVRPARGAGAGRERLAPRESRLEPLVLGELVGAQELKESEEPVRVVLERRGGQQQRVPAEGGDRRDRAVGGAPRMARSAGEGDAPRRRSEGRSPRPPPASVSFGRATKVSRPMTARRWASKGLKPGSEVALDVGQPSPRPGGRRPGGTSATARPATAR